MIGLMGPMMTETQHNTRASVVTKQKKPDEAIRAAIKAARANPIIDAAYRRACRKRDTRLAGFALAALGVVSGIWFATSSPSEPEPIDLGKLSTADLTARLKTLAIRHVRASEDLREAAEWVLENMSPDPAEYHSREDATLIRNAIRVVGRMGPSPRSAEWIAPLLSNPSGNMRRHASAWYRVVDPGWRTNDEVADDIRAIEKER